MPLTEFKTHPIGQSRLYRLTTTKKLSDLLMMSEKALKSFTDGTDRYNCWLEEKKNGSFRSIEAPYDNLKIVQRRIADLLGRITPPDYLMAPVKRRSYVDNAAIHVGSRAFKLLDIEDFFPSCTDKRVFWFFNKRMECAPDVAAVLTKLATFKGHLPQGSPCSPILAYYSYVDMWDEIDGIAKGAEYKLSIYADDITLSGVNVYEKDVWAIKQALHKRGHTYNQKKERSVVGKPVEVTGVIVKDELLLLPNRQHKEISRVKKASLISHGPEAVKIARQLRGRIAQARQISQANS